MEAFLWSIFLLLFCQRIQCEKFLKGDGTDEKCILHCEAYLICNKNWDEQRVEIEHILRGARSQSVAGKIESWQNAARRILQLANAWASEKEACLESCGGSEESRSKYLQSEHL